jgi:hypothetical protein
MTPRTQKVLKTIVDASAPVTMAISFLFFSWTIGERVGQSREALLIVFASMATAIIGVGSLYIARAAKRLPNRRRVFLSYSSDVTEDALALRELLTQKGAHVWLDKLELNPGDDSVSKVSAAIESSNTVVMLYPKALGRLAYFEISTAIAKKVPIIEVFGPGSTPSASTSPLSTVRVINSDRSNLADIADAAVQMS